MSAAGPASCGVVRTPSELRVAIHIFGYAFWPCSGCMDSTFQIRHPRKPTSELQLTGRSAPPSVGRASCPSSTGETPVPQRRLEPQPNGDCRHRRHVRPWVSLVPSCCAGNTDVVPGAQTPSATKSKFRSRYPKKSSWYDKKMRISSTRRAGGS